MNEVLAGIFDGEHRIWKPLPRAAAVWEPLKKSRFRSLPARHSRSLLRAATRPPSARRCYYVKFVDAGKNRSSAWRSSAARRRKPVCRCHCCQGADCLLTGEANHHHAIDARAAGRLSLIAAGHYLTIHFPVTAAVAAKLRAALPELEVLVSTENRDPYTYL